MSRLSDLKVQVSSGCVTVQGHCFSIPKVSFVREVVPRGANGLVFEAFDTILKRTVAVKIWVPRGNDPRDRTRQALAEAAKLAKLNHKNIVQIYSCGELDEGLIYSIMEFLEGKTLGEFLNVEHPGFADRVRIWREIEEAVEYAHCRGVYHGDLHDRNVVVVDGIAKVVDFGTSLFASKKMTPPLQESARLFRLSKEIFSECEPKPEQIIDVRIGNLKPELALSAISSWVSILWDWQEMLIARDLNNEGRVIRSSSRLAFDTCLAPVFSVSKLVSQLAKKGFSRRVQDYFVGYCVLWTEVRLQEPELDTRTPLRALDHNISLDRRSNEVSLKALWPCLRARFYQFGPFV